MWVRMSRENFVNGIVLGALAVMWIAVLSWEGVQSLRGGMGRRGDPMANFQRQLDILSRRPQQMSAANRLRFESGGSRLRRSPRFTPASRFEATCRRRDVMFALSCLTAAAAAGFYLTRTPLSSYVLVVTTVMLASFAYLVVRRRQLVAEQVAKVRYLPTASRAAQSPVYARRRAN